MWSKKWYLKRNITCDAHLLNELLETDVPWDDAIVVSAGKLRKVWDSLSELHSSLCERRLEDSSEACAIACQNCTVYSVFPSGMMSHSKIAHYNWKCIGRLRRGSAAASLLGLRVRIPLRWWMSVPCECGVLSCRGLCVQPIPRPQESRGVCVCVCVCVCVRACVCDQMQQ